ncbi:MAG: hypothetical protein IJU50_05090 [Lachnospiraceae bacterium]|nr:hypothetical protein [Lachnospiraceae bacterium]
MIDQEKVIMMTRLAAYEQREEKRDLEIGNYFRGDFICWELLKGLVFGSMAFLIGTGLLVFVNFETLLAMVYQIDWVEEGRKILKIYGVYMGVVLIGTYIASVYRFGKARKGLREYFKGLGKLQEADRL